MVLQIMTNKPVIQHEKSASDQDGIVDHHVSIRGNVFLKDLFGSRFEKDLAVILEKSRKQPGGSSHD